MHERACLLCAMLMLLSCGSKQEARRVESQPAASLPKAASAPAKQVSKAELSPDRRDQPFTTVVAHHVIFHQESGLQVRVGWLRGRMYATRPGSIPSFDDPTSFEVQIEEGAVGISLSGLSSVLNDRVFKGSKLEKVRLSPHGPLGIQVNAVLHKVLPLPVQMIGKLGTSSDGRIRIDVESVKVLKIPMKGLLDTVHVSAADLVNSQPSKGVSIEGNAIYISTADLLPPPRNIGKIKSVHFAANGDLVEDYGQPHADLEAARRWHNFMRLTGGMVRFGKLTMNNTDLVMIDNSPNNWFGFDLRNYTKQLVAGTMHVTESGGLQIYLPDISRVMKSAPVARSPNARPEQAARSY